MFFPNRVRGWKMRYTQPQQIEKRDLEADCMVRAGSVEGLALSAEMTVQPGIT